MLQALVPSAVPEPPVELVHVTEARPPLSRAVPCMDSELAGVVKVAIAGETTLRLGGAVPVEAGTAYNTCNAVLALVPLCATAVIVIVFTPVFNGIGPVLQVVVPLACPSPPVEFDQVTRAIPELAEAVPETEMLALAVV